MSDKVKRSRIGIAVVIGAFAIALGFGIGFRGCSSAAPSTGAVVVHNADEYREASLEARVFTEPILPKIDQDQPLSENEKDDLKKAIRLYDGMTNYMPTKPIPEFASGQIYEALGDHQDAIKRFKQYLDATVDFKGPADLITRADSHYLMSKAYLGLLDYNQALIEANEALKAYPGTVNYLIARASAYCQLNKRQEAINDLSDALAKEPDNRRAQGLYKLLNK